LFSVTGLRFQKNKRLA